jgi:V/A-type H+-transporting ATPase subunit E
MEVQLQDLIDTIKSKGIKEAKRQADEIKKKASEEAKQIIAGARNEAEELVHEARREIEAYRCASERALQQAARDLVLSLKSRIRGLFEAVVSTQASSVLKSDVLGKAVLAAVNGWIKNGTNDITLLVAEDDLKKVENLLIAKLAAEMKNGISIKPLPDIKAGFRIMETGGEAYYNITDEGITEILCEYLNPRLAVLLKKNDGQGE